MFFGGRTSWPQGLAWGGHVKICTTRSSTVFSWNCSRIRSRWGQWLPAIEGGVNLSCGTNQSPRDLLKMGWIDLQLCGIALWYGVRNNLHLLHLLLFSIKGAGNIWSPNNMKHRPAREVAWCDHVQEIFELYIGKIRNNKSKKRAMQESKAEVVPRQQTWSLTAPGRQVISLWMALETTRQMDVFRIPRSHRWKISKPLRVGGYCDIFWVYI